MTDSYILVTGGAGYIGSHTVRTLLDRDYRIIVFDDLSTGYREFVSDETVFIEGNTSDVNALENVFTRYPVDTVVHFAGYIDMAESMQEPGKYFHNNVTATLSLLNSMQKNEIRKIVFSSSAGIYRPTGSTLFSEDSPKGPSNPYGETKLMVENCLQWYDACHGIKSISIRYFNASGASLDASRGEAHQPESHIIPRIILAALGHDDTFRLFGTDYDTPDGTCVRDYIHVLDLADVHALAIEKLRDNSISTVYNAGTGKGFSNREIIDMVRNVTGLGIPVQTAPRRPGDATVVVGSPSRIMKNFSWKPRYSDLETIIRTAYNWHTTELYRKLTKAERIAR